MAPVFGSRIWQRRPFQKLDFAKMKRSCCCCLAANSSFFFLSAVLLYYPLNRQNAQTYVQKE